MGFFSVIDDELKPSDDYLSNNELVGYEPGDMEHEDYNIEDDTVALSLIRTCTNCKCHFSLQSAIREFNNYFEGEFFYMEEFVGQICGKCAIKDVEKDFE